MSVGDVAVEAMRASRARPVVLKTRLANLRSQCPALPIFVFEGDDDKIVYFHWINKIRQGLKYASFPCNGKGGVLELRSALVRDKTGLSASVYYFIDRDFDDYRGQQPGNDIFMTEMYSVENYLVNESVVDSILEIEFHCHCDPGIRKSILAQFALAYQGFLSITREVNRRIFIARKLGIDIRPLPKSVGKICQVSIYSVFPGTESPESSVVHVAEPQGDLPTALTAEFEALEPSARYRGKFALLFMEYWLRELAKEANGGGRGLFVGTEGRAGVRLSELTLNCYASRSPLPDGLAPFIQAIS